MPSLRHDAARHTVVVRKRGQYRCFPDVCLTQDGALLAVHRKAEQHVAQKPPSLHLSRSLDGGVTWSAPTLLRRQHGHCPRLAVLEDGVVVCIDDGPGVVYKSADHGHSWNRIDCPTIAHGLTDRVLPLAHDRWLTAAHIHRGASRHPAIGQAPVEQMLYVSQDQGLSWLPWSVIANDLHLVLCEASMTRLADGSLFVLLRENSFVGEPMYTVQSFDGGQSWTSPQPTPLIGHRPTMAWTQSGKLLVTYRNLGPEAGTAAFLGTPEELGARPSHFAPASPEADFRVHSRTSSGYQEFGDVSLHLFNDGMLFDNSVGAEGRIVFSLRPITDPSTASATLEAWVRVFDSEQRHACMRLGVWWMLSATSIKPAIRGARPLSLSPDQINHIRLEYVPGQVTCYVNNRKKRSYALPMDKQSLRPILFGSGHRSRRLNGRSLWTRVRLETEEPRYMRKYLWDWSPSKGLPDAWMRRRVLELLPAYGASFADFGYSGWAEPAPGEFCCVHHHADGREQGYAPGKRSWIVASRFREADLTNSA